MEQTVVSKQQIKDELRSLILNKGIAWGQGTNPNDKRYKWTFDTKAFLLDQNALNLVTKLFIDSIEHFKPDAVGGLTLASHLIASSICYSSFINRNIDAFFVRRERKQYGMQKLVEGPDISGKNVVIIDDGLNEAGFAQQAIDGVEALGCTVAGVVVLVNFERGDYRALQEQGYIVDSIFTLQELGMQPHTDEVDADLYTLKWRYCVVNNSSYGAPKSSPVIEENRVYVGSDQGKMLCFDFNGELVWEFKTDPHPYGVHQTPVIFEKKLIFSAYDGGIYALNKEDGSLIWKTKVSSFNGSSPIVDRDSGLIYVGLENSTKKGTLAALDLDGNILWEFQTSNHVPSRAVISGDSVIFGSNDCFAYALNKSNGTLLWKYRTDGEVKGRLTVDGDCCYATSFDGYLYCLHATTGDLIWRRKLGICLYSAPLVFRDIVIVGSYSNQVTALDKKSGIIRWYFMTQGSVQSYPTFHEDRVYVGSRDGCIYVLDAVSGKLIWKFITADAISSSPTCFKNKLFVSSNDGYLYCFEQ